MTDNQPPAPVSAAASPSKWKRWLLFLVPPLAILYVRAMAWLIDFLHDPPHERLVLALQYLGKALRLLVEPAPVAGLTAVVAILLLREPISRLIKLKVEALGAGVSLEVGPRLGDVGTKMKANDPALADSTKMDAVAVVPEANR